MAEARAASQSQLEVLERRWKERARQEAAEVEALYMRTAALAAAVQYSRRVSQHWGWAPWRALMEQARGKQHAAAALHAKHAAARVLHAMHEWRRLAAWRAVAAEACSTASARHHHKSRLLQCSLATLLQHALWVQQLPRLHAASVAATSLRHWQQLAAAAAAQTRRHSQMAVAHSNRRAARSMFTAWRLNAKLAARRERRWAAVLQYLAEYRASRKGQSCDDCSSATGTATSLSSAENSFDPNCIFYASEAPLHH